MKIIISMCLLIVFHYSYSQDPSFSQSSNNLTYLNPAFTGTAESMRAGFSYRNQWPGISRDYITTNLYVDQHLGKWGSLGLTYIHDLAGGIITSDNIYLDYAYQFDLGEEGVLSLGVELGYFQKSLDWDKLTFGTMINPRSGFVYPTNDMPRAGVIRNVDFGAGALYYNKFLFAGYGLHHINRPNESFYVGEPRLPMLHSFYAGGMIKIGEVNISPQVDFKSQNGFNNIFGIVKANYKWITTGIGFRDQDAYVGYLGISSKKFRVDYSYDVTVSKLSTATGGAHELSFMLFLNTFKNVNNRSLKIY